MTWAETSAYAFRKSESWLRDHLESLVAMGFPRPDPSFKLFFKRQVDVWLATRFGERPDSTKDWEAELIARTRNGKAPSAISGRQAP